MLEARVGFRPCVIFCCACRLYVLPPYLSFLLYNVSDMLLLTFHKMLLGFFANKKFPASHLLVLNIAHESEL